ncbi:hypothetical protein HDV00_010936 [Rhizophlyctis rosea]|nr:hypothetical protein HDV00_010936 [Rhizophlyctis rosea]
MQLRTFALTALAVSAYAQGGAPPVAEVIPGRYIVKLQAGTATTLADIKSYILNNLLTPANTPIPPSKIHFHHIINTNLYQGASLQIDGFSDREVRAALRRLPKIAGGPKSVKKFLRTKKPTRPRKPEKTAVPPEFSAASWHIKTGVDELHRKGIYGKGVRIGVIDTGIHWKHPALGGGLGDGYKVVVSKAFNEGVDTSVPIEDCKEGAGFHGTHVAGIIAGNATGITDPAWKPEFDWWGVAPQATLGSYQAECGTDSGSTDAYVAAIYAAKQYNMDIISCSFGDIRTTYDAALWEAVETVEKAGAVVVVATGNGGAAGAHTIASPAASPYALAVGSVDTNVLWGFKLVGPNGFTAPYLTVPGTDWSAAEGVRIVVGDLLSTDCGPLPINTTGAVVLYESGVSSYCSNFVERAQEAGAVGILEILPYDMIWEPYDVGFPYAYVSVDEGERILSALKSSPGSLWNVTGERVKAPLRNAGRPSWFTAIGLNSNLELKPDIMAYGGG